MLSRVILVIVSPGNLRSSEAFDEHVNQLSVESEHDTSNRSKSLCGHTGFTGCSDRTASLALKRAVCLNLCLPLCISPSDLLILPVGNCCLGLKLENVNVQSEQRQVIMFLKGDFINVFLSLGSACLCSQRVCWLAVFLSKHCVSVLVIRVTAVWVFISAGLKIHLQLSRESHQASGRTAATLTARFTAVYFYSHCLVQINEV